MWSMHHHPWPERAIRVRYWSPLFPMMCTALEYAMAFGGIDHASQLSSRCSAERSFRRSCFSFLDLAPS